MPTPINYLMRLRDCKLKEAKVRKIIFKSQKFNGRQFQCLSECAYLCRSDVKQQYKLAADYQTQKNVLLSGVNVMKLRIFVLRKLSPYFRKMENVAF